MGSPESIPHIRPPYLTYDQHHHIIKYTIDMYSLTACMSTPPVRKDEYGNQRLDLPANALGKDNH